MQNAAQLQQQVLALESQLASKDAELRELRELTQDMSQDMQAAKIIDLSKKNRALNLALEREKQRAAKLEADLAAGGSTGASAAAPEAIEAIARSMVEKAAEAAEAAQREAAQWKEKFTQTTNKISQLEQKVFALESENKRLTRALVREVGEEVPLSRLLDEGDAGDWKGRREQIIALREQVKQLKAAVGQAAPDSKQDQAAKSAITKIAKERNAELDRVSAELSASRLELEALKLKYDGAVSRRKILEADLTSMKQKVSVVLEKTQTDDRLIAALKAEVAQLRKGGAVGSAGPAGPSGRGRTSTSATPATDDELWAELGALRRRVAEQEEQIDRQEAIIVALQQRASAVSTPTGHSGPGRPGSGGKVWDGAVEQQMRLLEVENSRLTELVALLQRRLEGS